MVVYPFYVVYMQVPKTEDVPASILVSIPKKRFRHAVDRNRMKRLTREAYRRQKSILWDAIADSDQAVAIAFVCLANRLCSYQMVYGSMTKILHKIGEKIAKEKNGTPTSEEALLTE